MELSSLKPKKRQKLMNEKNQLLNVNTLAAYQQCQ